MLSIHGKGLRRLRDSSYNMAMGALICTRACYVDSSFYPIGIDYSEDDPYLVQEVASFPGSHGESLLLGQRCCKLLQESRSVLLGEASLAHSTHSRLKLEKLCYQDTGDDMKLFGLRYPCGEDFHKSYCLLPASTAISSNMTVNLDQTLTLSNEFKLIPARSSTPSLQAHVEPLTRPSLLALLLSQDIHGSSEFLRIGMWTALFWRFAADEHTVTFTVLMYKSLPLHYSK
ncbi:hypothetical protein BS47DRAFT_1369214 [Hydnum rufescens UP504]|uniref:Uncharacterized protein n=1 Tax=Hydnum rufescens UP504 TaxID=1448309 RepID=A0A9P6ADS5_9AGAM|nr:hypothetical protein BS47DRAFT_1369214 [Hydnum rufescens UP504]